VGPDTEPGAARPGIQVEPIAGDAILPVFAVAKLVHPEGPLVLPGDALAEPVDIAGPLLAGISSESGRMRATTVSSPVVAME
jgi:hypothetical protein